MSGAQKLRLAVLVGICGWACQGCESAHYVVRGPNQGVVAIPRDTPELRARAEKLMHDQFPGGYVIDDVREVPVGRPYRTITQVGPFAEVETHRRHEVMLYYHAGQPGVPVVSSPPILLPPIAVQPASATIQPSPSDGLPPQPVPVNQ